MNITKEQATLIKAIAILMVVIFHFQYDMFGGSFLIERGQGVFAWITDSLSYISQEPNAWVGFFMSLLVFGVNIFFVLSGYGLMKKFMKDGGVKLKNMFRQSLKILIPFWIAHPTIHIIDWILKNLQYQFGFIDYRTYFAGMHSIYQYFESMLIIPRWFSSEAMLSFVGTWWFIGIIIQFYLLFPLLFKLFKKLKPMNAFLICLAVTFIYRYVVSITTSGSPVGINEADIYLFVMFPARLAEFALGMYLAFELKTIKLKNKLYFSLPLILLGFLFLGNIHTMFVSDFLFALGGIMMAYSVTKPLKGYFKTVFNFIGKKSYSIYLYHEPTMKLILKFIFPNWINS